MEFSRLCAALFSSLCLLTILPVAKAQDDDGKVKLLPVTQDMEDAAAKAMQGCKPQGGKIYGVINKNGIYTLTGDLFRNGNIYAIIDDNDDVIICEWRKTKWKSIEAINVHTVWGFPNKYREPIVERGSNEPNPFWMLNLQNHPLLVIAGFVEKEGQNYYTILFDSKVERILDTASSFGNDAPGVKYGFLVTKNSSRVKLDFMGTYFSHIQNDKFVQIKSWEESYPWHATDREDQPDDSSMRASSEGKGYIILPDDSKSSHPADFVILSRSPKDFGKKSILEDAELGKSFAKLYFTLKNAKDDDIYAGPELAFLFEKLTGLPREYYKQVSLLNMDDIDLNKKIESDEKLSVKGTKEAVKLLSP